MSKKLPTLTPEGYPSDFRHEAFLDLIRQGFSETNALAAINFPRERYALIRIRNQEFSQKLSEAILERAGVWYDKIAATADVVTEKDLTPGAKLQFEKLKYLAEKDDPDRFGEKKKVETTHAISIMDFRNMSDREAQTILTTNPFASAIETTATVLEDEEGSDAL